ncbi:hypothetical protein GCM10009122_39800 [Fulvivirga kasyanovii]|uniref:DUF3575 domain-containing protein n=1 Tax=Fulvivirga kasyanovii TaxID=396812 RepID=A0ABW9RRV3_9BACT|nr:DUF3575 domain-containing protein [Fulvivirga kasyanovii]MTI26028.1 DUF3575 domain-containing protein [Fulvivirga kasyanovii]
MKIIQVVFLILAAYATVNGQDNKNNEKIYGGIPALSVKWSPLHLINTFPTVQIDAEVKIRDRMTVQVGGSPVVRLSEVDHRYNLDKKRGYKLKSEVRYYFLPVRQEDKKLAYVSLSFDYNRLKNDKSVTFEYDCNGQGCQYRQRTEIEERRIIYSLTHRIGVQKYLSPSFLIDINAGWGVRWGNYARFNEPAGYDNANETTDFFGFFSDYVETRVAIGLGVKLSVRIK